MVDRDRDTALMVVTEFGLRPLDRADGDLLSRYPVGAEVEVSIHEPQNPAYMRLLRAVIRDVYPNTDFVTADALMDHLKVRCGLVDHYTTMAGGVTVTPRSLADLQADELIEFGSAAMVLLATEIVPGLDVDALLRAKAKTMRRHG